MSDTESDAEKAQEDPAGVLSADERSALAEAHGGEIRGVSGVSWSRMSSYQQCPEQFRLSYVVGAVQEPSGAAIAGSAAHRVIEVMTREGWYADSLEVKHQSPHAFKVVFDEGLAAEGAEPVQDPDGQVRDWNGVRWAGRKRALRDDNNKVVKVNGKTVMVGENYPWMLMNGPLWIQRAASLLRADVAKGSHIIEANVERKVTAWLDGPGSRLVTGKIDLAILADEDGAPVIRDWKTGSHVNPLQLASYAWLLSNTDIDPIHLDVDTGEIAYLRGKTQDELLRTYDLREWLPLVPRMFTEMLEGVDADYFPLRPNMFCTSCWVKAHCVYGKTLPDS